MLGLDHGIMWSPAARLFASVPSTRNRLVVIQGQSNAGQMTVAANVSLSATYAAVQEFESTAGAGAADPPSFTTEGPRDLGPRLVGFGGAFAIGTGGVELSMGRRLDSLSDDTYFVAKQTMDGSSLVNHWANAAYPATGGNMMARSIAFIQARMSAWNITDATDVTLVWIQGEADGGQTYATYLASLVTYFSTLRATLGNIRVIIVRTVDVVDTSANVRAAQESYCADPANNARSLRIDTATLRDTAHWDDTSTVTIGNSLADLVLEMTAGTAQTSPYVAAVGPISVYSSIQSPAPTMPEHQANDTLVLTLVGNGTNNFTTPTDWLATADSPQAGGGVNPRVQTWIRRATDDATPGPTITDVASDGSKIAWITVIRGARTSGLATDAIDVTAGNTVTTTTAVAMPGDTSTVANGLVIGILGAVIDTNTPQLGDWTNADLTELTGHVNYSSSSGSGVTAAMFSGRKAAAGAFGTTTATLAATSAQARLTLVFKA